MVQDAAKLKEKILEFLQRRGPSLPVHIAKETGLSILFASAFLSELVSDKEVKISYMKVGGSPLYFIPSHASQIERFSQHLKSKEKDAFLLLKEKKFLKDSFQEPAIRVALRSIRDFAIPFERNSELFWRYIAVQEEEFKVEETKDEVIIKEEPKEIEEKTIIIEEKEEQIEEEESKPEIKESGIIVEEKPITKKRQTKEPKLEIFDKKEKKPAQKKPVKKKAPKHNEKFFEKIKEFLEKKSIDILGIEGFEKNELILRIKEGKTEKLLMAYNKKRITENDLITASKKSSEMNLPYLILSLGELPKKLSNFIEAVQNLSSMEKID